MVALHYTVDHDYESGHAGLTIMPLPGGSVSIVQCELLEQSDHILISEQQAKELYMVLRSMFEDTEE